jgi:hypothetical protein
MTKPIYVLDKVNWYCLSKNFNAIHIVEQNLDKVGWQGLVFFIWKSKCKSHIREKFG